MNTFPEPSRKGPFLSTLPKRTVLLGLVVLLALVLAGIRLLPTQSLTAAPKSADRKIMKVGVMRERPPIAFTYANEPDGPLHGLAIDLAHMLDQAMGVDTEFRVGNRDELFALLNSGEIDYICGLPQSLVPDGAMVQSLTTSFATNRRILVAKPDSYISSERDYKGHSLALLDDSEKYQSVAEAYGAKTTKVYSYQQGFALLTAGEVDAFVVPSGEIASYLILMEEVPDVRLMGLSLERYPTLIVLPKNATLLKSQLSGELVRFEEQGKLELLREKWYGRPLIREPSFWEKYQKALVLILGISLVLMLGAGAWSFLLKRQVRLVTGRLSRSEQRYRDLIEASPDLIMSMDQGGRIQFANRSTWESLTDGQGTRKESFFSIANPAGQQTLHDLLEKALQGKTARATLAFTPEANAKVFEIIAFPTTDSQSGAVLACCIARDMTEQQRMERELIQSERLAAIGKLAAGVAHEINNPLTIVHANAELVLKLDRDPAVQARIKTICRNVGRAAEITRRLLRLAVPERLNLTTVNLVRLLEESLDFLKHQLVEIEVDRSALPAELSLQGDEVLLEQLLINLLLNALNSMDGKGTLTLSGSLWPGSTLTPKVKLCIQDTGKGIPLADLDKIFDLFYTTRSSEGFGLGLFISKRIVEQHGGTIYAQSALGVGTTLNVEFPQNPDGASVQLGNV